MKTRHLAMTAALLALGIASRGAAQEATAPAAPPATVRLSLAEAISRALDAGTAVRIATTRDRKSVV